MDITKIHLHCKCCSCEEPLSKIPYLYQLPVKAAWSFPVWGNFLTGAANMAVAYLCDKCGTKPVDIAEIKYTVEFGSDNQVIYHDLQALRGSSHTTPDKN